MELMDVRAAAEYLGIGRTTLYELSKSRKISYYQAKPGANLKFDRQDLDAYMQKQRVQAREAAPESGCGLRLHSGTVRKRRKVV